MESSASETNTSSSMDTMTHANSLFDLPPHWYQKNAVIEARKAIADGEHLCITSPTGSGKTEIYKAIIRHGVNEGKRVILYTNRVMLTDQVVRTFDKVNLDHGVIAATHPDRMATLRDVQVASMHTVHSRVTKERMELPQADVVIVDEAHAQSAGMFHLNLNRHKEAGATIIGITATPVGLSHIYDRLYQAATTSQCRSEGRLIPAMMFAPSELDCSKIGTTRTGEFNRAEIAREMRVMNIVAHVYTDWKALNPDARPFIGYAPGVAEAKWFVDEFAARGVRTASVDGEDIYVDGQIFESDQATRSEIIEECRTGKIAGLWNRFVFREAIDLPWMYQCILATPIGLLQSYIQVVGRVLRSCAGMDKVLVTDHGGNYWRHKYSPNDDIDWSHYFGSCAGDPTEEQKKAIEQDPMLQPIVCPKCKAVRRSGKVCPMCGEQSLGRKRFVIQHDGQLKPVAGPVYKPPKVSTDPAVQKKWNSCYFRAKNSQMTFNQAIAMFRRENDWKYPPSDLKKMPKYEADYGRKVRHVPYEDLF